MPGRRRVRPTAAKVLASAFAGMRAAFGSSFSIVWLAGLPLDL